MNASTWLADFRHWFGAGPDRSPSGFAIVLHGSDGRAPGRLALALADYLNEFDDETEGHWMAFDPAMLECIAASPEERDRLGIGSGAASTGPVVLKKTIHALAKHGHAVLDTPLAAASTRELPGSFHVGLDLSAGVLDQCHMILNPKLFGSRCMAPVIGDAFLQWSVVCAREAKDV